MKGSSLSVHSSLFQNMAREQCTIWITPITIIILEDQLFSVEPAHNCPFLRPSHKRIPIEAALNMASSESEIQCWGEPSSATQISGKVKALKNIDAALKANFGPKATTEGGPEDNGGARKATQVGVEKEHPARPHFLLHGKSRLIQARKNVHIYVDASSSLEGVFLVLVARCGSSPGINLVGLLLTAC